MKDRRMRCEELEELVFSGREISARERQAMVEHARGCEACRALLEQEDVLRGARELDAQVEVPEAFSQRWRRAVRLSPQRTGLKQRVAALFDGHPRGRMAARLAAYACCAAVLFGVGVGLGSGQKEVEYIYAPDSPMFTRSSEQKGSAANSSYETAAGTGFYASSASSYSSANSDDSAEQGRKILRTAKLTLRTARFDEALAALCEQTVALGGSVTSSEVWGEVLTGRSATLELSIPAGELDGFLAGAGALGTVTRSESRAKDVTETYQDNASRLESARAQKQRLDELYAQAENMTDIVTLTDAIFAVQQEIDELEGKNRSIDARAANAQVTISLTESVELPEPLPASFTQKLSDQLRKGLEALGDFFSSLMLTLAWALPWLGVAAVVVLAVLLVRRRRRRR